MSENKKCQKCHAPLKGYWTLYNNRTNTSEYWCKLCLAERSKTCMKEYGELFFYDEKIEWENPDYFSGETGNAGGGQGQEIINFCSDKYNQEERIDKRNKDYCKCQLRCDRHRENPEYAEWTSDCKACWKLRCQRGYHDWGWDKCDKCGCSPNQARERERERAKPAKSSNKSNVMSVVSKKSEKKLMAQFLNVKNVAQKKLKF